VTWSPTIDPERLKLLSQQMVLEAGVRLVYHSLVCLPMLENGRVCGATFESKEGRMAIRAKVVVDATGDGDLFSRAGAACDTDIEENDVHHCMNTAWLFAGVDMNRWIEFKTGQPERFSDFMARGRATCGLFDRPFVSWRNEVALFMGPRQSGYSGLNVDDLSTVEIRSHEAMGRMLDFYRQHAPGFEQAFMMLSAPQIGIRHTRRLKGVDAVLRSRWADGVALPTEIGVSPSVSPKFPNISIPYGALVPEQLNGLIACGRHISCDRNSHGFMREIPQCWITGQAAGAAAALAVSSHVELRDLAVDTLQTVLLAQGVFLRPRRTVAESITSVAFDA
jgi:FAD dependent oxidoreductase